MQWHTRCESELDVEAKLLETKEVFTDILGEVTAHELLAAVIEGTSTVGARIVHSWSQKFSVIRPHPVMHATKLCTKPLDIVFDVSL
jgi:hypothetical protein